MWTNSFSLGKLDGSNFVLTQNQMHMPSCDNDIFRWLFVLTQGTPRTLSLCRVSHQLISWTLRLHIRYSLNIVDPVIWFYFYKVFLDDHLVVSCRIITSKNVL